MGDEVSVLLVGLCTVDLVQRVEELPAAGQKAQAGSVQTVAGGPAANAAVAVAGLGGRARLLTVLGAHPLAGIARDDLTSHRVRVLDLLPDRTEPPALSAVVVRERDGERVVVSYNAAGTPTELPTPAWPTLLDGVGALLVDGHHPQLAVRAARAARGRNIPIVLDAGSYKPVLDELLPLVDVCAAAEGFDLRAGSKHRWSRHAGARATDRAVHELGVPVLTRTHGAGPVRWSVASRSDDPSRRPRVVGGTVSPPPVTARDTLGAGDVWHGALAYQVARLGRVPVAEDLPAIVDAANRVAAARVRRVGARAWLADVPR